MEDASSASTGSAINIDTSAYESSNMEIEIESADSQQLRTFPRVYTYIYVFYISF